MIFEIKQEGNTSNMVWFATIGKEILATVISSLEKGQLNIEIDYTDGINQRLYYNPNGGSKERTIMDRFSFKIFRDKNLVGNIVGKNKKISGFLQSYPYREMILNDEHFFLYEVGFGSKGLFLCIYKEDELIAIVDKELRVVNYKDKYTAYCSDKANIEIIVPFVLYYDITAHGDMMEVSLRSVKRKKVNTIQKELLSKYDSEFIEKIKSQDE